MKTPAKFHSLVRFQFHATGHNASTAKLPASSEETFRSIPNTALAAPTWRAAAMTRGWLFGLQVERRDIESQLDLVGGGCDSVSRRGSPGDHGRVARARNHGATLGRANPRAPREPSADLERAARSDRLIRVTIPSHAFFSRAGYVSSKQ